MKRLLFLLIVSIIAIQYYAISQTTIWAERISGYYSENVEDIAIDGIGNVYLAGYYYSDTIKFNNSIYLTNTTTDRAEAFIAKYNSAGECQWAEKIYGIDDENDNRDDKGICIAIDNNGNIYVAGEFESTILNFNNGKSLTNVEYADSFIAKYNNSGECQWAEKIAGNFSDYISKIEIDNSGNILLSGDFDSEILTFNNGITLSNTNFNDGFIAKYNSSGECQWAEKIAGDLGENVENLVVNDDNDIYITGYFDSDTTNFNNGKSLSKSGSEDAFVAKYNSNGVCQWADKIYGSGSELATALTIDDFGDIYLLGEFDSDTTYFNNSKFIENGGKYDAFLTKYNSSGICQWVEKIGGEENEFTRDIAVNKCGNIYLIGEFESDTLRFNNLIYVENDTIVDTYFAKYNSLGECQWAEKISGTIYDYVKALSLDAIGNTFISGEFLLGTVTFNNNKSLTNTENSLDAYIVKYFDDDAFSMLAPTLLNPINVAANLGANITFEWNEVLGADSYTIQVSKVNNFSTTIIDDNTVSNQFDITSLENGNTYYWRVKAINTSEESDWSEIWSFSTSSSTTFKIPLSIGWNMISSYVVPEETDMDSVFQDIVDNILIAKNGAGKLYVPAYNINTIGNWNIHHGYQVYATAKDTLKISGIPAEPETDSIFTSAGWNMLGYLRDSPMASPTAMVSLTEFNKLLIAKNGKGKLYVPAYNINTIGNFVPGDGYQIYITGPDTLIYPPNIIEEYETVVIGEQEWMQKNLDVTHYRNGNAIFHAESSEDWQYASDNGIGAWCYYNNDEENGAIFSKLYNWYAVNDSRGLAPDGYHVPSDTEWTQLTDYLSDNSQYWCNNNSSYIAKSIASKEYWYSSSSTCVVGNNLDANNITGFKGFPAGYRDYNNYFGNKGDGTTWWSSTEDNETYAWSRYIFYFSTNVYGLNHNKGYGFSVRCVKD